MQRAKAFYWCLHLALPVVLLLSAGLAAVSSPHLLLGILSCSNGAVTSVLSKAGIQMEPFAALVGGLVVD